jgi:hypothetical protein
VGSFTQKGGTIFSFNINGSNRSLSEISTSKSIASGAGLIGNLNFAAKQ